MSAELIGVIGTIAGTILGWVLGLFSQRGKLHIYSEWDEEFTRDDRYGGFKASTRKENVDYFSYHLRLDLYNNSGEPRIMRKVEVVFFQDKKELFRSTPQDDSTGRQSGPLRFYDKILPLTIPAKTIITVKLHGGSNKRDSNMKKIWDANRIELSYRNEKDHEKHVLIKKEHFAHYFENHPVDENDENGGETS